MAGAATAAFADFTESFDTGPTGWLVTPLVFTFGNNVGGDDLAFSSGTWHALNNSVGGPGQTGVFCNPTIWDGGANPGTHSGAGQACMNFANSTGSNTIDTYLMSPTLTFHNGDVISFWTRTSDVVSFPDRLLLKLSTSGASTSAAAFSTTLLTVNPALNTTDYPSIYTQFTATVSGLSGASSGRFALNYNVTNAGPNGANSDFITIDDVSYTAASTVPEPASLAVLAIGAVALVRRRKTA